MLNNKKMGKEIILKSILVIMFSVLTIAILKSGFVGTTLNASASDDSSSKPAQSCDREPTGVETEDYWLDFLTENMPDPNLNNLAAQMRVHRAKPVYANGKCPGVPNLAVVLIHGRGIPGSVVFDLRHCPDENPECNLEDPEESGTISMQVSLAKAGIESFAPDLLGYGLSSRLVLDDPHNDGSCSYKNVDGVCTFTDPPVTDPEKKGECCDNTRSAQVFPLNQQARYLGDVPGNTTVDGLGVNPLEGVKYKHLSSKYFSRPDVWARNIIQVIDDAIAKSEPRGGKVVLLGYSFGGPSVARTLYLLGDDADRKIRRVVFMSALFNRFVGIPGDVNLPTQEEDLSDTELSTSFPLTLFRLTGWPGVGARQNFCTGRVISNVTEEFWGQVKALDSLGAEWGGSDPDNPTGLLRGPTFTNYGFNPSVVATFTLPTLILQGAEDGTVPRANADNIFNSLTSISNKVLVQVECSGHQFPLEGCSLARCDDGDPNTTPYGQDSQIWAGPYSTVAAALIEWIKYGTFDGSECGQFNVNPSGVVSSEIPCQEP
jgi:pimeloyl-ACP methyl ester carboxylesterase